MSISTLSSSTNSINQQQKDAILSTFADTVKGMDDKQKDQFAANMFAQATTIKNSIMVDSPEFAEKVLRDAEQGATFAAQLNAEKSAARNAQDDEVVRLKAELNDKDKALSKANKIIKSNEKDMQAMSTIELGPKKVTKLILLQRQQKKMNYFLKKDPIAGMVYIYNSGMLGVRHLRRAVHGKKFMFGLLNFQEDPSKVKLQFQAYIGKLQDFATTPKQKVVVKQLVEQIKQVNDKYVDLYNKKRGPQKFNS